MAPVEQPVEESGRREPVVQDLAPVLEALVGGRHGRGASVAGVGASVAGVGASVAGVDQLEEQPDPVRSDREIAESRPRPAGRSASAS